jgi:hypoxanthine phosphoribosyltransferase
MQAAAQVFNRQESRQRIYMQSEALEQLFSKEFISRRVHALAEEISRDYAGVRPVIIGILKGSFVFLSDLLRVLKIDADIDFIQVSSYGSSKVTSGSCVLKKDITLDVAQRHVLLIDDIIDTGLTTAFLKELLEKRSPQSLRTCFLINKQVDRRCDIAVDYFAFSVDDGFVVGYGLDFDERFRGLPEIYRLRPS